MTLRPANDIADDIMEAVHGQYWDVGRRGHDREPLFTLRDRISAALTAREREVRAECRALVGDPDDADRPTRGGIDMTVSAREALGKARERMRQYFDLGQIMAIDRLAKAHAAMIAESKQEGGGSDSTRMGHRPDIAEPGQAGLSAKYAEVAKEMGIPLSAPAPQAGEEGPIVVRLFMLVDNMSAGLTKAHWRPEAIKDAEATIFAAIDALRAAVRERDEARADSNHNSAIAREIGISRFEADAELATLRSVVDRAVVVLDEAINLPNMRLEARWSLVRETLSIILSSAALANPPDQIGDSG